MNSSVVAMRDQVAENYLHHLQGLAFEISRAMECIAANALPGFRDSVAQQETHCVRLAGLIQARGGAELWSDPALDSKINQASTAIRELTMQYAALLQHSGRSVALLASLCRSYTGQFQEARGVRSKHQTWSCEM